MADGISLRSNKSFILSTIWRCSGSCSSREHVGAGKQDMNNHTNQGYIPLDSLQQVLFVTLEIQHICSSCMFFQPGLAIIFGKIWVLLLPFFDVDSLLFRHVVLRKEEAYLANKFLEKWGDYCTSTRRWM